MRKEYSKENSNPLHERENREAEKLSRELESTLGAQKLGDEAYELVKKELIEKKMLS